jgi:uncharacterized protein involved in exopolysaccharide biosynthesis/Mrp family chromosome partitioning ATPase
MKQAELSLSTTNEPDAGEPSLELAGLVHALLRRVWLIVLCGIAFGLAAAAYVKHLPDQYRSTTVVQIESQSALKPDDSSATDLRDPVVVETVIQNFLTRSLMERVARELNLVDRPGFLGRTDGSPASEADVVSILSSATSAAARPRTLLVDVSFTHPDPTVPQELARTIVEQSLLQNTEQQIMHAEAQNQLLLKKAAELKTKLSKSEKAVQEYKNQMESVSVDAGRNLVESKLQGLSGSLTAARNERLRIESDLNLFKAVPKGDSDRLIGIAGVASDPQVAAATSRVKTFESEIQTLSDRYRQKHPKMIEARNRLEDAKAAQLEGVRTAPDRVAARYAGAQANERTLEKAVAEQEKDLLKLDEMTTPYRALQQELAADRALYDGVQKRLKETALLMDFKPVTFRIVESAGTAHPLPNQRLLIIIAGVFGGVLLAAALVAAIFLLDSSVKTVDEAERLLGLPVLAAVPIWRKGRSPESALTLFDQPDSPCAESFRSLRTAVSLLGPADRRKVILFTSAVPSEGKTLTAANTAIALAQQGLRTVILDADLRRPALSRLLLAEDAKLRKSAEYTIGVDGTWRRGREEDTKPPGIAEYMIGESPAPRPTKVENLFFLPAGGKAPNPAELLASPRFAELVETMKQQFDRVIIDTAPVNVVSDTLSIVKTAQTIVLVVRNNSTSRKVVRRALELLRRAHVRPDGIALNFMPHWSGIGSHYYYSSDEKYGGEETYSSSYQPPAPGRPDAASAAT